MCAIILLLLSVAKRQRMRFWDLVAAMSPIFVGAETIVRSSSIGMVISWELGISEIFTAVMSGLIPKMSFILLCVVVWHCSRELLHTGRALAFCVVLICWVIWLDSYLLARAIFDPIFGSPYG